MPRRGNPFQSVVRELHTHAPEGAKVSESTLVEDRSTGELREVDVLIELDVHGYPLKIAVECTATGRPADVTWVDQMVQKHVDLPTDKLVLVSQSGFTQAAEKKAHSKNVSTLHLQDVETHAWTTVVGKKQALVLESIRAHIEISITTESDDEWPGLTLDRGEILQREEVAIPVARFIDAILTQQHLLKAAISVSLNAEGQACMIEFDPAPGITLTRRTGEVLPVIDLRAVLIPHITRDTVQLRSGQLGNAAVAFGGIRDAAGRELDISVIERPGGGVHASYTERVPGAPSRVQHWLTPC